MFGDDGDRTDGDDDKNLSAAAAAQPPQRDASGKTSADAVFDDIKAKAMEAKRQEAEAVAEAKGGKA